MAGMFLNRSRQAPAEETPAFGAVAERFRRAGDHDRAIALCRDGLKKFPNQLSARVTLGWSLLDTGAYDQAREELEQVLRRAPDNLAAIRGLAELHDRSENSVSTMDAASAWHRHAETVEIVQEESGVEYAAGDEDAGNPGDLGNNDAYLTAQARVGHETPAMSSAVADVPVEVAPQQEAARTNAAYRDHAAPATAAATFDHAPVVRSPEPAMFTALDDGATPVPFEMDAPVSIPEPEAPASIEAADVVADTVVTLDGLGEADSLDQLISAASAEPAAAVVETAPDAVTEPDPRPGPDRRRRGAGSHRGTGRCGDRARCHIRRRPSGGIRRRRQARSRSGGPRGAPKRGRADAIGPVGSRARTSTDGGLES